MDDDDAELAAMRAMRKAKLGDAGTTRGEAARVARESFFSQEEENLDDLPQEFRAQLPMSFGKQQPSSSNRTKIHESTRRTAPSAASNRSQAAAAAAELASGPQMGPPRPNRLNERVTANATDSSNNEERSAPASEQAEELVGPPIPRQQSDDFVGPPRPPTQPSDSFVGPPRPGSLPKPSADVQDEGMIGPPAPQRSAGPPPPPKFNESPDDRVANSANGHSVDNDAGSDDPALPQLPVSNEVVLRGHHKIVSCMDVERSGARVITGGMDYQVCLYDFNGMKADGKPFRELMPQEGHPVHAVTFSPSGDAFLVATGEPRAKVYDRDGREKGEFKRGDMYLRDLKNTKGHVAGLTHGQWHPLDRHSAMTSSTDGTIRLWDCENIEQKMVIKPTGASGRVPVSACCYSPDGNYIAGALTNGTIQIWTTTGNFGKSAALDVINVPQAQMPLFGKQTWKYTGSAKHIAKNAHPKGTEVSDIKMLRDGVSLLTRGADDTLKLWDIRLLTQAVHVWDVPATHTHTRMCVSPKEDLVLTGSVSQESGSATLEAFRLKPPYDLTHRIGMPSNVTSVFWHPIINQLLVGCGDRTSGSVHVLYSPERSEKGALLCAGKKNRPKNPIDFQPTPIIHTPGALPMFRDDSWRKRKRAPEGGAVVKRSQIPDPGPSVAGAGGGGKIGATSNTLLTQYLLEKGGMKRLDTQMDPREAILRHKDAEKDMAIYTKAYEKTQPEKKFAEPEEGE